MNKELLQQALDALIDSLDLVAGAHAEAVELYSTSRQARIVGLKRELDAHEAAIKALEAAIAQPVKQAIYDALKLAGNRLQRIALELPHAQRVECHEWAHEAFEAIAQPVPTTYGCVMVPVDPTPEMLDRGANCAEYCHQNVYESDAEKIYAAMIAAAPQAIAQPAQPTKN